MKMGYLFKITPYIRPFINKALNVLVAMVVCHIFQKETGRIFFHALLVGYKLIQISSKFKISVSISL